MALSFTVTRGYSFPAGRPVTLAALRLAALPGLAFTGSVASGDMADGAVTPAKASPGAYFYGAASGTNAYAVTLSPALGAYANGVQIVVKFTNANTTAAAPTLDVNLLGAKGIYHRSGQVPKAGDLQANEIFVLVYNSSRNTGAGGWDILGKVPNDLVRAGTSGGTGAAYTFTTANGAAATDLAGLSNQVLLWKCSTANTSTTPTLAIDGLTAKTIVKRTGAAVALGDLVQDATYILLYDATLDRVVVMNIGQGRPEMEVVATDSGAANAYAIAPTPAYTALTELQNRFLTFLPANTNTGASTLAVSGLTATAITKWGSVPQGPGELRANRPATVFYDGTRFQLTGCPPPAAGKAWAKFNGTPTSKTINVTPSGNNVTVTGHGITAATTLENVTMGVLGNTGTAPTGLSKGTHYYLHVVDANTLTFHTTAQGALDGTSNTVALSGAGSGTVTLFYIAPAVRTNVAGVVPGWSSGASTDAGDYTVYFVNAFATADYGTLGTAKEIAGPNGAIVSVHTSDSGVAGSKRLQVRGDGGVVGNVAECSVFFIGTI